MFNLKDFVKSNLLAGFQNSSFTMEQVNIFATNYFLKGLFVEEDVIEINDAMKPAEPIEE